MDQNGELLRDNEPESDVLAMVFYLGILLCTFDGGLKSYSPGMQLSHCYEQDTQQAQQYSSNLVEVPKLVRFQVCVVQ